MIQISAIGNIIIGEYAPNNGYNYKVIAVPWHCDKHMNMLGTVNNGWLVVNCNNAKSYLFQNHGYLADSYIREKLGGFEDDYPYFGDLVRKVLGRELGRELSREEGGKE